MNVIEMLPVMPFVQPVNRLKKMREQNDENNVVVRIRHDNFLAGHIQSSVCFRRIKYACLLGRYYWIRNRYETLDEHRFDLSHTAHESKFTHYDATDVSYLELMRIEAQHATKTDFAVIGVGLGLEMECLESFLVNSVKGETSSKYVIGKSRKVGTKKQAKAAVIDIECIPNSEFIDEVKKARKPRLAKTTAASINNQTAKAARKSGKSAAKSAETKAVKATTKTAVKSRKTKSANVVDMSSTGEKYDA